MKTYMVAFKGTAYIIADSKEKAQEIMLDDLFDCDYEDVEVESFEIEEED